MVRIYKNKSPGEISWRRGKRKGKAETAAEKKKKAENEDEVTAAKCILYKSVTDLFLTIPLR